MTYQTSILDSTLELHFVQCKVMVSNMSLFKSHSNSSSELEQQVPFFLVSFCDEGKHVVGHCLQDHLEYLALGLFNIK